jgi:hypothetical protein
MPRNSPGAIRAGRRADSTPQWLFSRINGLSPRAHEAIGILEANRLGPGAVARALNNYADFLDQPGRWLYLPDSCDCPCDLPWARDILDEAIRRSPEAARAELRRIVSSLDAQFVARTLPDPRPASTVSLTRVMPPWWHRRLRR